MWDIFNYDAIRSQSFGIFLACNQLCVRLSVKNVTVLSVKMLQRIKTKEHPIDLASYSSSWLKKTTFTKQAIGLSNDLSSFSPTGDSIFTLVNPRRLNTVDSTFEFCRVYTLICKIKALFKTSGTHFRKRTVASEQNMLTCRVFWETQGLFLMHRKPEGSVRWSCVDSRFMPKPFSMAEIRHFSLSLCLYDVFTQSFECIQGFILSIM